MQQSVSIVWYKRDLRVHDHRPLFEASSLQCPVLPLYVVEPELWQQSFASSRHWFFVHDCLVELRAATEKMGQALVVREGEITDVFSELSKAFNIISIHAHEETGNGWTFERDKRVIRWCKDHDVAFVEYPCNGIVRRLPSRDAWSGIREQRLKQPLTPKPARLLPVRNLPIGDIPDKTSMPIKHQVSGDIQSGGRRAAIATLRSFLESRGEEYVYRLSTPRGSAYHCSRLSPHLAWGTLTSKEVIHSMTNKKQQLSAAEKKRWNKNYKALSARLAWRCHFIQKLEDQPDIEFYCMHPAFEGMREQHNEAYFERWKKGETGYPLVDACMRQLIAEGWITFRLRAMLVSFASYHLWLDWRKTGNYLARLFTDFEPGIHYSQMQMQSGVTGINTLRIYNPIKQSQEKDPQGYYIKQWLPALRKVPDPWIHQPWLMNENIQRQTECVIGKDYPMPIVDHAIAVKAARKNIEQVQKQQEFKQEAQVVYAKLGSRKKTKKAKKSSKATKKPVSSKSGSSKIDSAQMSLKLD